LKVTVIDRFDAVHAGYRRTRDALKIAHRSLRNNPRMRRRSRFANDTEQEVDGEFLAMYDRLQDATIINLWVVFERFVIEHVTSSLPAGSSMPAAFADRLRAKASAEIERWRFDEVLDLYKGWIDSNELGVAKQIKAYRDWVAHQNPQKTPSASIDPEAAYELLASIVEAIQAPGTGSSGPPS
jgi:hypothetical protein